MLAWYAAQTKPCSEFIAEDWLRSNGFKPFNPKFRETAFRRGSKVTSERPYFSGYIFVSMDCDIVRWQRVNSARGVKKLICVDERPLRIPNESMQLVLDFCDEQDFVPAFEVDRTLVRTFKLGEVLKVREGQWAGFTGPVAQVQKQRTKLLLTLFGRQTRVEFDARELEKV